jgi:hypothetical protein
LIGCVEIAPMCLAATADFYAVEGIRRTNQADTTILPHKTLIRIKFYFKLLVQAETTRADNADSRSRLLVDLHKLQALRRRRGGGIAQAAPGRVRRRPRGYAKNQLDYLAKTAQEAARHDGSTGDHTAPGIVSKAGNALISTKNQRSIMPLNDGRVAEWFKAAVLKTAVRASVPWVRIPPLPPRAYAPTCENT